MPVGTPSRRATKHAAVFQAADHLSRHRDIAVEHGVGLARALHDLIRIGNVSVEAQFVARRTEQLTLDLEMLEEVIGNNDQTQRHGPPRVGSFTAPRLFKECAAYRMSMMR